MNDFGGNWCFGCYNSGDVAGDKTGGGDDNGDDLNRTDTNYC